MKWSEEEKELVRILSEQGYSDAYIGHLLGRSWRAIQTYRRKYIKVKKYEKQQIHKMMHLIEPYFPILLESLKDMQTITRKELAEITGIEQNRIGLLNNILTEMRRMGWIRKWSAKRWKIIHENLPNRYIPLSEILQITPKNDRVKIITAINTPIKK